MKPTRIITAIGLLTLTTALTSCKTAAPPQVFHPNDHTALIIDSLDNQTCQVLQPSAVAAPQSNDSVLNQALNLPQHDEAIVILENYNEAQFGDQFRDRGTSWFVGLRNLGYQHIIFLQGRGIANPDGLMTLVDYD